MNAAVRAARPALLTALWMSLVTSCNRREQLSARRDPWDTNGLDGSIFDGDGPDHGSDVAADADEVDVPPADACASSSLVPSPWTPMLKVSAADHGIDGWLEAFFAKGSGDVAVRLRPSAAAQSVVMFGEAYAMEERAPRLRTLRFGDSPRTGVLVRFAKPVGWNFIATVYAAAEIDGGKLTRARARHVASTATRDVQVWDLDTGVGRLEAAEVRPSSHCGYELVQVDCSSWFPDVKKKPAGRCESRNRIFFVHGAKWWWAEKLGMSCVPKDNGYCYPPSPLPGPSEFPAAIAPTAASEW
ncbi:MAG: hypothetical protein HYV09_40910 [Deltaproteobacteria bacterium]|nr:hypothetical protein [Deltaproteobacteria bacterium]